MDADIVLDELDKEMRARITCLESVKKSERTNASIDAYKNVRVLIKRKQMEMS
jgi:hypothetical protein